MTKNEVYKQELAKLEEVFRDVEEGKRKLVEGLIEDAAFIKAENFIIKQVIEKNGMIKIHPINTGLQKPTEAAKQYLKNINSYSVVIKALNGVLQKNVVEADDEFDSFISEMGTNA